MPHPEITARVAHLLVRLAVGESADEEMGQQLLQRRRVIHELGLAETMSRLLVSQFQASSVFPADGRSVFEASQAFRELLERAEAEGTEPNFEPDMFLPMDADGGGLGHAGVDLVMTLRGIEFAAEAGVFQGVPDELDEVDVSLLQGLVDGDDESKQEG